MQGTMEHISAKNLNPWKRASVKIKHATHNQNRFSFGTNNSVRTSSEKFQDSPRRATHVVKSSNNVGYPDTGASSERSDSLVPVPPGEFSGAFVQDLNKRLSSRSTMFSKKRDVRLELEVYLLRKEKEKSREKRQSIVNQGSLCRPGRRLTVGKNSHKLKCALNGELGTEVLRHMAKEGNTVTVLEDDEEMEESQDEGEGEVRQEKPEEPEDQVLEVVRPAPVLSKVRGFSVSIKHKIRNMGKLAIALKECLEATEDKQRKDRIAKRWDIVRSIVRTSLAVNHLRQKHLRTNEFVDAERFRECMKVEPSRRSPEILRYLATRLAELKIFQDYHITFENRLQLSASAQFLTLEKGDTLFRQGDTGKYYYAIFSGKVDVVILDVPSNRGSRKTEKRPRPSKTGSTFERRRTSLTNSGKLTRVTAVKPEVPRVSVAADNKKKLCVVAHLMKGQGFGGLAIIREPHIARMATVRAAQRTEILQIEPDVYRGIILPHEEKKLNGPLHFFRTVPGFKCLTEKEISTLAMSSTLCKFRSGDTIVEQNGFLLESEFLGIVRSGRVRAVRYVNENGEVVDTVPGQPPKGEFVYEFDIKRKGDILREGGTLKQKNQNPLSSIAFIAETCVQVLFVPRNIFYFTLMHGDKIAQISKFLKSYPKGLKLKDMMQQRQTWERFRARIVTNILQETPKGRRMLERMGEEKDVKKKKQIIDREKLQFEHMKRTVARSTHPPPRGPHDPTNYYYDAVNPLGVLTQLAVTEQVENEPVHSDNQKQDVADTPAARPGVISVKY